MTGDRPAGPPTGAGGTTCFICNAVRAPALDVPWHDEVLAASESAVVMAGVGAFLPGYLLIAPRDHIPAILTIDEARRDAFTESAKRFIRLATTIYGDCTLFEHGGTEDEHQRTSACIDHAHLHVLPGSYDLGSSDVDVVGSFDRFDDLMRLSSTSYLMFRDPGGPYVLARDLGSPQFFRRQVARALGQSDEWDYAAVPRFDVVAQTIDTMRHHLRALGHRS